MNWNNLKIMKCPKCSSELLNNGGKILHSVGIPCDFTIGIIKFNEIVNNLYKPKKFHSDEYRLSELNNLGRKEVSKDFSDSKYLDY